MSVLFLLYLFFFKQLSQETEPLLEVSFFSSVHANWTTLHGEIYSQT